MDCIRLFSFKTEKIMIRRVVPWGEMMLSLPTPGYFRIVQAKEFVATYGGGEANLAV
jgi:2-dehydro-3-deoxygluconokinase